MITRERATSPGDLAAWTTCWQSPLLSGRRIGRARASLWRHSAVCQASPRAIVTRLAVTAAAASEVKNAITDATSPGSIVLRPGARADIVLIDLKSSTYAPLLWLPRHLVYGEDGRSIRMVMVDGEIVVQNCRVLTLDEDALLEEIRGLMSPWLASQGPVERWAERLRPYVEQMYRRCARFDVGFTRWLSDPRDVTKDHSF